jgi:hypothetical protein
MSRKFVSRRSARLSRRPSASEIPPVPTFNSGPDDKQNEVAPTATGPDPDEEAVRKMVEAAYT